MRAAPPPPASAAPAPGAASEGRSARKRKAIMEAATTLFLRNGYGGTSMDDIAAIAAVSKQTVYKHFSDKERLFTDLVLDITDRAAELSREMTLMLEDTEDLERDLRELARRHITSVIQPQVLQLRRLVIAEAGRFPELARTYYERAPERVLATLASSLQHLAERGLLRVDDPLLAANHFAWLVLSVPLDRAMFYGLETPPSRRELERLADAGARVFLEAYRAR
jgi:TetR/AcrR family transcriptional repressor of mexJK operon